MNKADSHMPKYIKQIQIYDCLSKYIIFNIGYKQTIKS